VVSPLRLRPVDGHALEDVETPEQQSDLAERGGIVGAPERLRERPDLRMPRQPQIDGVSDVGRALGRQESDVGEVFAERRRRVPFASDGHDLDAR
jgi:hypothetical protein